MLLEIPASTATRSRVLSALGLLVALGLFSLPFGSWMHYSASLANRVGYELVVWAWSAAVLLYVSRVERRPLSSIGFRALGLKDALISILAGVLILAALALIYYVVFPALHWSETGEVSSVLSLPYWLNVLIVVRAAVAEEILFRAYPIERLEELTGSRVVAGVLPCAVFTFDHLGFWGWHHILVAGTAGAALTLLYLWRRNIWVNMIAHFIVDAAAFLA